MKTAEKKLIHDLLNLRSKTLFKTTQQYDAFASTVRGNYKKHLKELKQQIRLLRKVCKFVHTTHVSCHPYYTRK